MKTALTLQASIERAALVTEEAMAACSVLVDGVESMFVTETPTGLDFDPETPIEVWARLVVRLIVQHKRIEFALADAINFGEAAYGDLYAHWCQETGLNKRTLQNYARVGRLVEPERRRATMSFSHHAEVASLPAPDQERLLEAAEAAGMTRYELRDAVRNDPELARRRAEAMVGGESEPAHCWMPTIDDLADDERAALEAHAPGGRLRQGYVAGWIRALLYHECREAFAPGRWRE